MWQGSPQPDQPSPHSCIQKWFLSLAADSRRKHRSGYLVSAIYLQLELKGEKTQTRKENQIFKCSSKDTVHVCTLNKCSPSPSPSLPLPWFPTCEFCWCSSLWESFLDGRKRVYNVWVVWLHANHRGCETRHGAGCQRLRAGALLWVCVVNPAPNARLPKGCLPD